MIINGDALTVLKRMDSESVHMAVTSPPYYSPVKGLRDYNASMLWPDGWDGELGSESTPQQYVSHLSLICMELYRVLRPDGTFYLNLGDSRAGSGRGPSGKNAMIKNQEERQGFVGKQETIPGGFKRTDMFGIPFRTGIALQESGWYWKDCIPWVKHNGMPGSYKNRPVSTIEWILILTKTPNNYYDYVAVMQKSSESYNKDKRPRGKLRQTVNPNSKYPDEGQFKKQDNTGNSTYTGFNARYAETGGSDKRLLRSSDFFFQSFSGMWLNEERDPMALVINNSSYGGKHYASFPVALPEVCILASSSEKGVCPRCGSPWIRNIRKTSTTAHDGKTDCDYDDVGSAANRLALLRQAARENGEEYSTTVQTTGWSPTCSCPNNVPIPAIVLDPFGGSSATGVACKLHKRNYIGIELNPEYCKLGEQRVREGG